jgi:hypothetical protein
MSLSIVIHTSNGCPSNGFCSSPLRTSSPRVVILTKGTKEPVAGEMIISYFRVSHSLLKVAVQEIKNLELKLSPGRANTIFFVGTVVVVAVAVAAGASSNTVTVVESAAAVAASIIVLSSGVVIIIISNIRIFLYIFMGNIKIDIKYIL